MAKDGKFGMFGGVFTPSILTILGVIMYLRLPWMVGNSGLYLAIGIIGIAHLISVTTGLSISSIATDKKVGAGGPYYIISRSFGLPIGGSIGLALFLGLSFSISLYVIGFSESFLGYIGIEPSATNIRLCGTATIILLTIITFISTSLAIKTQYVILLFIALSLFSIFLGSGTAESTMTSPPADGPGFAVMFGIFFPAVTGFTAGVNMSGDLRHPKSAIPKGTMLAISLGLIVYVGLAFFLSMRVDPEQLRSNPSVLEDMSLWGPLVIAGVWGATLSSALGSILGAPRILQAMSNDRITPRVFGKGFGPTLEPRNALYLAFAIGEAGILIAQLDVIARVVSMVFLAMYGSVNIACAIESWASPDFRPKFRIPAIVSIIGAVGCILLMIQLDVVAMIGATALMLLAFVLLKRRQLSLESGDTWEGVWASVVRIGLSRLHKSKGQQRNWRPNMMMFDEANHPRHSYIRDFSLSLVTGNGMVTDFALHEKRSGQRAPGSSDEAAGLFNQSIATNDSLETIRALCQHHGFSGVHPNTLLLPWRWHAESKADYLDTLRVAVDNQLNLLLFEERRVEPDRKETPRIDVWWSADGGNLALSIALVRFLTRAPEWENAETRVLLIGSGIEDEDQLLRAKAIRHLDEARVDATLRIIPPPVGTTSHQSLIVDTSRDAGLSIVGLPTDLHRVESGFLDSLEEIAALPGGVVFLHANDAFPRILGTAAVRRERARSMSGLELDDPESQELPEPEHPEVAEVATAMYAGLRTTLKRWHERAISPVYKRHIELCERVQALVEKRYDALLKAANEPKSPRTRSRANRATSSFLVEAEKCLAEFADDSLAAQISLLEDELAVLLERDALLPDGVPVALRISHARARFAAQEDDDPALRSWKSGQRLRWFYRRKLPQTIGLAQLTRYYHAEVVHTLVQKTVHRFQRDSHELVVELGRLLSAAERRAHVHLNRQVTAADSDFDATQHLERMRAATLEKVAELRAHQRERIDDHRALILRRYVEFATQLGSDVARLDAGEFIERERRRHKPGQATMATLKTQPEQVRERQAAVVKRARLAVRIAAFRHQLTVTSMRSLEQISAGIRSSALQVCQKLHADLLEQREQANQLPGKVPTIPNEPSFDASPVAVRFAHAVAPMTAELPEVETTLTDESILGLSQGQLDSVETVTLSVRGGLQAMIETELVARFETEAARVSTIQSHAWVVARDTIRLLAAQSQSQSVAPDDSGDESGGDDGIASILEYSITRMESECERLAEFLASLDEGVMNALDHVSTTTGLLSFAGALSGAQKRDTRKPSRIASAVRSVGGRARDLAARAIYRRSVGRVQSGRSAEQLRQLVVSAQGESKVLDKLPRYYQHLFLGALNINEAFFIGRDRELEIASFALTDPDHAGHRVVLVSGERGSGKTTFCQQLATGLKRPTIWVAPPPSGSASAESFRNALTAAVGNQGTPQQQLSSLERGTIVVLDDVDLWWERRPGGLSAIDEMLRVIRTSTSDVSFLLVASSYAIGLLDDMRPISRLALAHVRCEPLHAQQIKDVVMARHTSTGLHMQLGNTAEESLTEWSLARLFHAHFEYARGNVGYSLRAWIAHIAEVDDELLDIVTPRPRNWDALGDLRAELVAILVELLLHKYATIDKLQRVTNMGASELSDAVDELRAVGLVSEHRRGVFQMSQSIHVPVTRWLNRGSLA